MKIETKLPAGEIVKLVKLEDGTWVVTQNVAEVRKPLGENFILIDAESLSLDDAFMQYEPKNGDEEDLKALLTEAITKGVKNFYCPIMDPSFAEDGIAYVAGKKPALCKSYNWWVDTAKKYDPSRKSRLGTRLEYCAFLGVLIKKLVEEGKSVEESWNAVCNDSKELGHYMDSKNPKREFEPTGSRCICGFYDLANTCKILAEDDEGAGGFWHASCCYRNSGYRSLADLYHGAGRNYDHDYCVGWLVLS